MTHSEHPFSFVVIACLLGIGAVLGAGIWDLRDINTCNDLADRLREQQALTQSVRVRLRACHELGLSDSMRPTPAYTDALAECPLLGLDDDECEAFLANERNARSCQRVLCEDMLWFEQAVCERDDIAPELAALRLEIQEERWRREDVGNRLREVLEKVYHQAGRENELEPFWP